jgi:hypothetical protein
VIPNEQHLLARTIVARVPAQGRLAVRLGLFVPAERSQQPRMVPVPPRTHEIGIP